jgi:hypothetical protein
MRMLAEARPVKLFLRATRQQASVSALRGVSCGAITYSYEERTCPHTVVSSGFRRISLLTSFDDLVEHHYTTSQSRGHAHPGAHISATCRRGLISSRAFLRIRQAGSPITTHFLQEHHRPYYSESSVRENVCGDAYSAGRVEQHGITLPTGGDGVSSSLTMTFRIECVLLVGFSRSHEEYRAGSSPWQPNAHLVKRPAS